MVKKTNAYGFFYYLKEVRTITGEEKIVKFMRECIGIHLCLELHNLNKYSIC